MVFCVFNSSHIPYKSEVVPKYCSCSLNFVCGRTMKLIQILSFSLLKWVTIYAFFQPILGLNKTKRTLVDTATYGEKPAPIFYSLPDGVRPDFFATTKSFALAKPPLPAVFDPEVPKQVAAQQVLYEYQQTPTNAVSNVHVKQLFQPLELNDGNAIPHNGQNSQIVQQPQHQHHTYQNGNNAQTSETIVNPVHHSSLVNHGQNYAHVQLQPYYPQHSQTQHYVPGRYLYVNGKYNYPPLIPTHNSPQSQNQFQISNAPQPTNKLPISYITFGNPKTVLRQKINPPPTSAPMNLNKFLPPQKQDIQQITKPVKPSPKVHETVTEDEEEENSSIEKEENNEEEDDDKASYEEESEENDDLYGKYHDDDDEELGSYTDHHSDEEDEDDDNERKSSKVVRVHHSPRKNGKNKPKRKSHNDKNNYAWSESYSHSSKYENGKKKADKVKESKKYDSHNKKGDKRKNRSNKGTDRIEGRYSQNVPVVQEHKMFREKWYLSQSKNSDKKL
ncbi:hypothetical protein WA026_022538 [Henosepilachna vigintioctopunctata]|uniref:Uncharacterized protein n=1 Tax=Henosepilachna vigintioctopunctata TaxID=420089 RepID=A0AAW1VB06_9CUCU